MPDDTHLDPAALLDQHQAIIIKRVPWTRGMDSCDWCGGGEPSETALYVQHRRHDDAPDTPLNCLSARIFHPLCFMGLIVVGAQHIATEAQAALRQAGLE